jgi:hypothetical protein
MFEQFEPMRMGKRVGELRTTRKNLLSRTRALTSHMHPRQVLLREYMPRRLKVGCAIECADIEMRFGRQPCAFAGQSRPAAGAKPAPCSSRRRVEFGYFTLGYRISHTFKGDKHRSGRAAMLAATLTMAPVDALWLTSRHKTDCTTQTTSFELVGCATHDLILPSLAQLAALRTSPSTDSRNLGEIRGSRWRYSNSRLTLALPSWQARRRAAGRGPTSRRPPPKDRGRRSSKGLPRRRR